MSKEPRLKKEFDLDEIHIKWEDEVFPEEKMLGTLILPEEKRKFKK